MRQIFVFLVLLTATSLACQSSGMVASLIETATPLPTPTLTAVPIRTRSSIHSPTPTPVCLSSAFAKAIGDNLTRIDYYTFKFPATEAVPWNGSALNTALAELRTIRAQVDISVPDCLSNETRTVLDWIDGLLDMYSGYQKTKNLDQFLAKWEKVGDKGDSAVTILRNWIDRSGLIPTPTAVAVIGSTIKIIDWTWYPSGSGSYIYVDGQLENISEKPLRGVKVNIVLKDQSGKLLATDSGYADADILNPRQRTNFKVMTAKRPGTYTVAITSVDWR